MAASVEMIDAFCGSIVGLSSRDEARTVPARGDELLVAHQPPWLDDAVTKLTALMELREGWDSHGARPPAPDTIMDAAQLLAGLYNLGLPKPAIVPTAGGGIQLEWDVNGVELELTLEPDGRMFALFDDPSVGESLEKNLAPRDLGPIHRELQRIARARRDG